MPRPLLFSQIAFVAMLAIASAFAAPARAAAADEPLDYRRDIQPILARHCYECHGAEAQESGLRLDTVAAAKEGGYNGPAIVPGKSGQSLLIAALSGGGDVPRMPADRDPLSTEEIERLRRWIDQGAVAPADDIAAPAGDSPGDPEKRRGADHWAFRPLGRPAPPAVSRPEWVRNPIDAFTWRGSTRRD